MDILSIAFPTRTRVLGGVCVRGERFSSRTARCPATWGMLSFSRRWEGRAAPATPRSMRAAGEKKSEGQPWSGRARCVCQDVRGSLQQVRAREVDGLSGDGRAYGRVLGAQRTRYPVSDEGEEVEHPQGVCEQQDLGPEFERAADAWEERVARVRVVQEEEDGAGGDPVEKDGWVGFGERGGLRNDEPRQRIDRRAGGGTAESSDPVWGVRVEDGGAKDRRARAE